mmetsp:Transcript_16956/g.25448  ORF Transcript_16956/g.25448 Transcript_16956/m.25448 type:complete len:169 (+) Transcript_16956:477-983(+)
MYEFKAGREFDCFHVNFRYGPANENEKCLFVASDEEDRVLGCVGLEVVNVGVDGNPDAEDLEPRPLLEFLAVDSKARGRGLGKSLLKQCEEKAKYWGYKEIILQVKADNNVAIGLYKKMGYSVVSEDNTILRPKEGGLLGGMNFEPALHLCMQKELGSGILASLPKLF